jgi:hypothetical protein
MEYLQRLWTWIAAACWWLADRLWGDAVFAKIKPVIPAWISEWIVREVYTWLPIVVLVVIGLYLARGSKRPPPFTTQVVYNDSSTRTTTINYHYPSPVRDEAFIDMDSSLNIREAQNVTSVSDTTATAYTLTFVTDFKSATYSVVELEDTPRIKSLSRAKGEPLPRGTLPEAEKSSRQGVAQVMAILELAQTSP